jgi:hypothetical protein
VKSLLQKHCNIASNRAEELKLMKSKEHFTVRILNAQAPKFIELFFVQLMIGRTGFVRKIVAASTGVRARTSYLHRKGMSSITA